MNLTRREVLERGVMGLGAWLARATESRPAVTGRRVLTVTGSVDSSELGITLMHEHVLVDFIGAGEVSKSRYDSDEAYEVILPHLREVQLQGCQTLVECTPAYIGRDPALLKRLSRVSGLRIITNTGYYGAAEDKYVPDHAHTETAEELSDRWVREFEKGIEGTGVRPGLMKIGVDKGPLSEIDAKLVRAAALTHLRTGLTIASHTGDGVAAMAQLKLLQEMGVGPSAFIWVHAQTESDSEFHYRAAKAGAWVEFDGVHNDSLDRHLALVQSMIQKGYLRRTLISQDAGWYHVGEQRGGAYRGYDVLFTHFLPALRRRSVSEKQIRTLTQVNPQRALGIQIRKSSKKSK
ncbi:MAG: phosphotriesterase [Acidobacteriota bacterium]